MKKSNVLLSSYIEFMQCLSALPHNVYFYQAWIKELWHKCMCDPRIWINLLLRSLVPLAPLNPWNWVPGAAEHSRDQSWQVPRAALMLTAQDNRHPSLYTCKALWGQLIFFCFVTCYKTHFSSNSLFKKLLSCQLWKLM